MELVLDKDALSSLVQRNYADVSQGDRVVRVYLTSGVIEPAEYCKVFSVKKGTVTTKSKKKILVAIPLTKPSSPLEKPSDALTLTWSEFLNAINQPLEKETVLRRKVTIKVSIPNVGIFRSKSCTTLQIDDSCDKILLVLV